MIKVDTFDGGLSTRIDASLIKPNNAQRFVNVDPNSVVLRSSKNYLLDSSVLVNRNFTKFKSTYLSTSEDRLYVEYNNKLYYTNKTENPKVFDGTTHKNMGIEKPKSDPVTNTDGTPVLDINGSQLTGLTFTLSSLPDLNVAISDNSTPGGIFLILVNYRIAIISRGKNVKKYDFTAYVRSVSGDVKDSIVTLRIPAYNNLLINIY